jgi:hypothetical protein
MLKNVLLIVDRQSWDKAAPAFRHSCPQAFPQEAAATDLEVLGSLLQVGILTVPPKAASFSLAAYWAHIRYITAIDLADDFLKLHREWENIDPHQKTILSDDWGVGFTMHWLSLRLCYREFCDGRYFIDRLKGLGIAHVEKPPKKKGTYKCPDFVTRDVSGKYHLIECKGTQSGSAHLSVQLQDAAPQKVNILFSDEQNQVGQRLAAGLFIASAKSKEKSLLAIADPPPRDHDKRAFNTPVVVRIAHVEPQRIADPLVRADVGRHLQLAGASRVAAELFALPARNLAGQRSRRRSFEDSLASFEKSAGVVDDLWLERTVRVPLAEPIYYKGQMWRGVRLLHAVSRQYVKALHDYDPAGETLLTQLPALRQTEFEGTEQGRLGWVSAEEDTGSAIYRAGIFRSELQLE